MSESFEVSEQGPELTVEGQDVLAPAGVFGVGLRRRARVAVRERGWTQAQMRLSARRRLAAAQSWRRARSAGRSGNGARGLIRVASRRESRSETVRLRARYRIRTCGPLRVKQALFR